MLTQLNKRLYRKCTDYLVGGRDREALGHPRGEGYPSIIIMGINGREESGSTG